MPGVTYADGIQSAWALDVPIVQVEQLIELLETQGYFTDSLASDERAELSRINGVSYSKHWQSMPELNKLVRNVRLQGKLVSHRQPLELPASPPLAAPAALARTDAAVTAAVYTAPAEPPAASLTERLPPVEWAGHSRGVVSRQ